MKGTDRYTVAKNSSNKNTQLETCQIIEISVYRVSNYLAWDCIKWYYAFKNGFVKLKEIHKRYTEATYFMSFFAETSLNDINDILVETLEVHEGVEERKQQLGGHQVNVHIRPATQARQHRQ